MDRNLLLLVLCLQVFLLVTASTVPQAAYLDAVGRQEQNHGQVDDPRKRFRRKRRHTYCGFRASACTLYAAKPSPDPKIDTEPTQKPELKAAGAQQT
ncbi:unnamed protein product [Ophioblennius macclurei]